MSEFNQLGVDMSAVIPLSISSKRRPLHGDAIDHDLTIYENPIPILFGCPACPLMMAMQAKHYHSDDNSSSESWQRFINPICTVEKGSHC